jgi:predicted membrane protein (TIGR00267 family)
MVSLIVELTWPLTLTRSHLIARRYFVVNGFDGALTMLGLLVRFYMSDEVKLPVVISACLGVAIAWEWAASAALILGIREAAEKRRELRELEKAMVTDLRQSAHGRAARLLPVVIALVNGIAPLAISLVILLPLWAAPLLKPHALPPLESAFVLALMIIFLLGVYLGRISHTFWLWAGLRTLLIAAATTAFIFALSPE